MAVKPVVASTHSLEFHLVVAAMLLQRLLDRGGLGIGAGCQAVGRSLRTPPSLASPRAGSRSCVLAPQRVAAGPVFGWIESSNANTSRPSTNGLGSARHSVSHTAYHGSFTDAMNV